MFVFSIDIGNQKNVERLQGDFKRLHQKGQLCGILQEVFSSQLSKDIQGTKVKVSD